MHQLKKEIKSHIFRLVIIFLIVIIFLFLVERYNHKLFIEAPEKIKSFFDSFGFLSPIIFLGLYILGSLLLIPIYVFVFISGVTYGIFYGIILSIIGEFISSFLCFYLARKIETKFVVHRIKDYRIKFVKKYISKHGFGVIFLLRYFGFYFEVVSYAAGLTNIRFKKFIYATIIGFLPYIIIYTIAGSRLMSLKSIDFIYFIVIAKFILLGLFIFSYLVVKAIERHREKKLDIKKNRKKR